MTGQGVEIIGSLVYNLPLMKYAVIKLQGKQYKLTEGEKLTVDFLDKPAEEVFAAQEVLLMVDGQKQQVGTPTVKGAEVKLKVLESGKGEKIRVFKYKAKSKYRKTIGHRQKQTNVEVVSIS
jgi:large subunit ribosomal protein L21